MLWPMGKTRLLYDYVNIRTSVSEGINACSSDIAFWPWYCGSGRFEFQASEVDYRSQYKREE